MTLLMGIGLFVVSVDLELSVNRLRDIAKSIRDISACIWRYPEIELKLSLNRSEISRVEKDTSRNAQGSRFFARNSNVMNASPSIAAHRIATNFDKCHDMSVVSWATICSGNIRIGMRVKWNFHRVWTAMEKSLAKGPLNGMASSRDIKCIQGSISNPLINIANI